MATSSVVPFIPSWTLASAGAGSGVAYELLIQPVALGGEGIKLAARGLRGPVSYTQSSGTPIYASTFSMLNVKVVWPESADSTGTYGVRPFHADQGATTCTMHWYVLSSGAEVPNGTDLSGSTIRLMVIGN